MCIGVSGDRGRYSISDAPSWSVPNGCPNQRTRLMSSFTSSQGSSARKFKRYIFEVCTTPKQTPAAVGQCSRVSLDASPSRRFDGCNGRAHHAILLSLGPLVAEADLLEEAARG